MARKNYNKCVFKILTTNGMYTMEEFEEYKDEFGYDGTYDEWCNENDEINFKDDLKAIRDYEPYNVPVMLTGIVERWDRKRSIQPHKFDSAYDALMSFLNGSYDSVDVVYADGKLNLFGYHHDGVNEFTIRPLSAHGIRHIDRLINGDIRLRDDDTKRFSYLYA